MRQPHVTVTHQILTITNPRGIKLTLDVAALLYKYMKHLLSNHVVALPSPHYYT
jgi:hypothetical protein